MNPASFAQRWIHPAALGAWLVGLSLLQTTQALDKGRRPTETEVLKELLQVESQVQRALPRARQAVVALQTGTGTASGVIVSPEGLIMTAAHVAEEPGLSIHVVTEDGKTHTAKTLGLDTATDAALARLDGTRMDWPHVTLADRSTASNAGDWCFALGHPGGFDKNRGEVLRVGKVVKTTANSLHTDCVLMGGDSGGPLFDLEGHIIGIHSLIWEGRDQNVHVSLAPFLRSWDAMLASEVIRTWARGSGAYLGVATRMTDDVEVEIVDILNDSPAGSSDLKVGDVIVSINEQAITDQPQFSSMIRDRKAGEEVTIVVKRGLAPKAEKHAISVKLGDRQEEAPR